MSTKMYNYRIAKDQFWPFTRACREFYKTEHPIIKMMATTSGDIDKFSAFNKAVDDLAPEWTMDLQLFDEGDTWLIRVLESGYFFMNNCELWPLERVYYDSRSDVPPEEKKNRLVAEWVDERINSHEYLIFPLWSRDDYIQLFFDRIR